MALMGSPGRHIACGHSIFDQWGPNLCLFVIHEGHRRADSPNVRRIVLMAGGAVVHENRQGILIESRRVLSGRGGGKAQRHQGAQ